VWGWLAGREVQEGSESGRKFSGADTGEGAAFAPFLWPGPRLETPLLLLLLPSSARWPPWHHLNCTTILTALQAPGL